MSNFLCLLLVFTLLSSGTGDFSLLWYGGLTGLCYSSGTPVVVVLPCDVAYMPLVFYDTLSRRSAASSVRLGWHGSVNSSMYICVSFSTCIGFFPVFCSPFADWCFFLWIDFFHDHTLLGVPIFLPMSGSKRFKSVHRILVMCSTVPLSCTILYVPSVLG